MDAKFSLCLCHDFAVKYLLWFMIFWIIVHDVKYKFVVVASKDFGLYFFWQIVILNSIVNVAGRLLL